MKWGPAPAMESAFPEPVFKGQHGGRVKRNMYVIAREVLGVSAGLLEVEARKLMSQRSR